MTNKYQRLFRQIIGVSIFLSLCGIIMDSTLTSWAKMFPILMSNPVTFAIISITCILVSVVVSDVVYKWFVSDSVIYKVNKQNTKDKIIYGKSRKSK
jgi:hypothetical protein